MRIFIPSKGRSQTIATHTLLQGFDYTIVVANTQEYTAYTQNPTIDPNHLVCADIPYGVAHARQWILNQVEVDEWFLMMDDNISAITAVPDPYYQYEELYPEAMSKDMQEVVRKGFEENIISGDNFINICGQTCAKAEEIGAKLCGFATVDNWYFRTKKWRDVGFVVGKMALVKKSFLQYDLAFTAMDDYQFTAENLLFFGKVLINNYVFRNSAHYQQGGIGTYKNREPKKIQDSQFLMDRYPGLFRYKSKKGMHPQAEVQIRFTSSEQVKEWRKKMLKGIV